jgi:hypothetical protein
MRSFRVLLIVLFVSPSVWARYQAGLIKDYSGRHQEEFVTQFDRVRLLVHQAQLEVSSRLGLLQYREGFQYPIMIRFEDGAPLGIESSVAYVRLEKTNTGFIQELVVNLDASATSDLNFDRVFYHEMTHAVLNDVIGGDASEKVPAWVQEGLAQYVSGEGPDRIKELAQTVKKFQAESLLSDLNSAPTGRAYPQFYLAIQYLYDKHSVNAVQALVRNLILGKSVVDAVEDSCGLSWDKFQDEVHAYSLKVFQDNARPDY